MRSLAGAQARGEARLVVVAEDPVGPGAGGKQGFVLADEVGDAVGLPGREDELEVEGHVRAAKLRDRGGIVGRRGGVGAVVGDELVEREVDLADQEAVGGAVAFGVGVD